MEQSDGKEHVEQITNSSSADGGTSGATSAVGAGAGASTASTEKGGDAIVYAHYGGGGSSSGGRGGGSLSVVDQVKAFFFEELSFTDLFNGTVHTHCKTASHVNSVCSTKHTRWFNRVGIRQSRRG